MAENEVTTEEVTEEAQEEQKFDADYVKQLREEAKSYRKEKSALKKEHEELQAKLKEFENEKLTDVEKKEAKIKELEKQLTDISNQTKQKEIDNLILKNITGKDIVDVEAAMLFIHKELASEDEVNDEVVTKVIGNILKAKPYLVNSNSVKAGAGNFAKQDNKVARSVDELLLEELKGK